jgi:hypothetical protein
MRTCSPPPTVDDRREVVPGATAQREAIDELCVELEAVTDSISDATV